jgi:hypothetical protein
MPINKERRGSQGSDELLQHGSIVAAPEIGHPNNIPVESLQRWLTYAQSFCGTRYQVLAFTQIPSQRREELGFTGEFPPRVAFYRLETSERGRLLINPVVNVHDDEGYFPRLERSESIGGISILNNRPSQVVIQGYSFEENDSELKRVKIDQPNPFRDMSSFLMEMLNGRTALDNPSTFFNPYNREDMEELLTVYRNISREELFRIISEESPNGLLGYVHERKQIVYLDPRNQLAECGVFDPQKVGMKPKMK